MRRGCKRFGIVLLSIALLCGCSRQMPDSSAKEGVLPESMDGQGSGRYEERKVSGGHATQMYHRVTVATGESMQLKYTGEEEEVLAVYVTADGQREEIAFAVPQGESAIGAYLWGGEDAHFYVTLSQSVYRVHPAEGRLEYLFAPGEGVFLRYLAVCGDYMYVLASGRLYMYCLSAGEMVQSDEVLEAFLAESMQDSYVPGENTCLISGDESGDRIYVVTHEGIYAHVVYGSSMELLVDGAACSIGDIGRYFDSMKVEQGEEAPEFLLACSDGTAYRYVYNREASAEQITEIRVYSLYDSHLMRLAAGEYHKLHPEVTIRIEVGMTGKDGTTENDAVKNLSAQFAAGKGPDILLMDGLPLAAYVEKDMLADLSGLPATMEGMDAPLAQVAESYRTGENIYCIPATFSYAVMMGKRKYLENVHTLQELADAAERAREEEPERELFDFYNAGDALEVLSLGTYGSFLDEKGELNREIVTDFLRQSKRIYEAQMEGLAEPQASWWHNDIGFMADYSGILGRRFSLPRTIDERAMAMYIWQKAFSVGWMEGSLQKMSIWISVVNKMEDDAYMYVPMPGSDQYHFTADNLLAVNRNTEVLTEAEDFIRYLLSYAFQKEQIKELGGIPVNEALCMVWEPLGIGSRNGVPISSTRVDEFGEELGEISYDWPTEEEVEMLRELTMQFDGVQICPTVVYDKVLEEGKHYLLGACSLEEAVDAIDAGVRLYLAE